MKNNESVLPWSILVVKLKTKNYDPKYVEKAVNNFEALLSACNVAFDFIDGIENFNDEAKDILETLREAINEAQA